LFDTKTFTGAYARILFSSRANIPVSMNPLIYVNESIDLCQRDTAVPESSARFPRSAGSFAPKDCFPLGRGTGAQKSACRLGPGEPCTSRLYGEFWAWLPSRWARPVCRPPPLSNVLAQACRAFRLAAPPTAFGRRPGDKFPTQSG